MASINLDADLGARGFLKGTKDMENALEDVSDALEDTGKAGDDNIDKLSDKLKKAKKDADDARDAGKSLGKGFKEGTDKASEGVKDLNDNAKSNLKEVTASFDGSAQSIADGFQGLAAEAFEGFGPAGVLAGAAVAAGIGLATQAFTDNEEKSKAAKERIRQFGLAIIDSGSAAASLDYVNEQLKLIITNADDAPKKFEDIRKATKDTELSAGLMAKAYAGNEDAIKQASAAIDEQIQKEKEHYTVTTDGEKVYSSKIITLGAVKDEFKKITDETLAANQVEADYLASGGAEIEAKAAAISQINSAYDEAVYSVEDFKNAETGIYDLEAYAQSIRDREALLLEYQGALAESGLTTEQKAALNEMGVEQANAILKGLKDPNTSQQTKDTIKKGLGTAAKEGSGVAEEEIKNAFKAPIDATIKATADTATAQADLDRIAQKRIAQIQVDFVNRYGQRVN